MIRKEKNEIIIFFRRFFLFSIFFIFIFWVINVMYIKTVMIHSKLSVSERQFKENSKNTKIVFLGDSHVLAAADPGIIENSFNFASSGESSRETYHKLMWAFRDKHFQPSMIILPLDIHSFSSFRHNELDNEWYWMDKINIKEFFKTSKKQCLRGIIDYLFPIIGNGNNIFYGQKDAKLFLGHERRSGNFSKIEDRKGAGEKRVSDHLGNSKLIDENLFSYYIKVLDLARNKNIKVVAIKYPVSKEYLEASNNFVKDEKSHYNYIEGVLRQHGIAKILDYRNFFQDEKYFEDVDHLNWKGAEMFSQQIKSEIENL